MHLQRVQVPNFRALKNIDITFEKERIPRIFPLASLNGGGKSTLLQLIFTLLTCSADPDKHEFIINLLKDFEIDYNSGSTLAIIELSDGGHSIFLDFSCHSTCSIVNEFSPDKEINILKEFGFIECSKKMNGLVEETQLLKLERESITIQLENLRIKEESIETRKNSPFVKSSIIDDYLQPSTLFDVSEEEKWIQSMAYERKLQQIELELDSKIDEIIHFANANKNKKEILDTLLADNQYHICSYRLNDDYDEVNILCLVRGDDVHTDVLQEISKKVFLAAPASQVFLFFNRQDIDCLFGNTIDNETYEHAARKNQDRLLGFFLHDFSTIKILAEAFEKAKENDWQQAIQTRGQYGTEYARISRDLEHVFSGKIIEPLKDLSGIIIKTIENGKERILHPEDLSHGELRRLTFYAWLRTKEIQDSIVLVDEIEIGLHPDWQYQIVKDLEEWAPSNQYILATHSYEICSALTPAHVKEIEPKLVKP